MPRVERDPSARCEREPRTDARAVSAGRSRRTTMVRRQSVRDILVLLLASLVVGACTSRDSRAGEGCPPSVFTYFFKSHGGDTDIPGVAFDTTIVNTDGDTTRVAFDHEASHLTLKAVGREWAGERILERFDLTGAPVGTQVPATIVFGLEGYVLNWCGGGGCGAYFDATLATSVDSVIVDASIPGPCDSCVKQVH